MAIKIAPSLLASDFMNLEREIKAVEKAGADLLHLDVMDGHFVPNLTFGLPIIKQIRKITDMKLDVHLMVTNHNFHIQELGKIGVDYISFHQEVDFHIHRSIYQIKDFGIKAGIALNPGTPIETIKHVIPDLDFVLLMSVNPGFGGQKFIGSAYQKVTELAHLAAKENENLEIQVDGGVNSEIAKKLVKAGATILVAGSYVFNSKNYEEQIRSLR